MYLWPRSLSCPALICNSARRGVGRLAERRRLDVNDRKHETGHQPTRTRRSLGRRQVVHLGDEFADPLDRFLGLLQGSDRSDVSFSKTSSPRAVSPRAPTELSAQDLLGRFRRTRSPSTPTEIRLQKQFGQPVHLGLDFEPRRGPFGGSAWPPSRGGASPFLRL